MSRRFLEYTLFTPSVRVNDWVKLLSGIWNIYNGCGINIYSDIKSGGNNASSNWNSKVDDMIVKLL